jgi:anti-sigma factor RsiW
MNDRTDSGPLSSADERLLHRYHDGESSPDEAAAVRARLDAEPRLSRRLQELRGVSSLFAAGREQRIVAPAGFTAGVLAAARHLPFDARVREADDDAGVVRLCRRLLIAAAIVFGLGLVWQGGLLAVGGDDTLQAAPDDVQREMERLDALIESGRVPPAARRGESTGK